MDTVNEVVVPITSLLTTDVAQKNVTSENYEAVDNEDTVELSSSSSESDHQRAKLFNWAGNHNFVVSSSQIMKVNSFNFPHPL